MRGVGLRVLVIDDDADGLDCLATLLETWGYEVERARSGTEGLGAFISRPPGIVVLDLGLADIDGCEVIRRMRANAIGDVLIIAYSGFHRLVADAIAAGADTFVLKPNLDALEAF